MTTKRSGSLRHSLPAAALLAGLTTSLPVLAQAPAQPQGSSDQSRAVQQLSSNVLFWSQRGQPEQAMQDVERVLAVTPRDPDTLATAARTAFQLGLYNIGDNYRTRLRAVAPNDPRLASLAAERQLSPQELQTLDDARRLVSAGRKDDALVAYRKLFRNGQVPDSLAVEYYVTLATSTDPGAKDAGAQLAAVAARWPGDPSFKLAYAQLQTYSEATRVDGIEMLRELSHVNAVAAGAKNAWREALSWQGPDIKTRDQLREYLADYPDDAQMAEKLKQVEGELPDEGLLARMRAYEAMSSNRSEDAEAGFTTALAHNPNDAEAMIMLSIIRRQQHRLKESDQLIARAIELAPDRRDEFVKDIGFDPLTLGSQTAVQTATGGRNYVPNRGNNGGDGGRAIRQAYQHVTDLTKRGEFASAEAELRRLMGAHPPAAAFVQMGYLQLQAGQLNDAETSFKRVLAARPRDSAALNGLASVYARQGREADSQAIFARLGITGQGAGLGQTRAAALRTQASTTADPAEKVRLLREAIAADPSSPWVRLDLARFLNASGQPAEARSVMSGVGSGAHPPPDQVQAALIWAQTINDYSGVESLVARLPAKQRTPQIDALTARAEIATDVARAPDAATLVAVAGKPDPTGARGQAVSAALIRSGNKPAVRDAVRAGLLATHPPTATQRLVYASSLADAGYPEQARSLVQQVSPATLSPQLRTTYNGLADGLAIQQADRLNQEGKRADAYDALRPRLQADPDSVSVNLAVSRLYASEGKSRQAWQVAESALRQSPSDLDAQRATVDAAIQAQEFSRARQIASSAVESSPDDPRGFLMQADIARARGDTGAALAALRKARTVRQTQLASDPSAR